MTQRSVMLYELNEVSWQVIDRYLFAQLEWSARCSANEVGDFHHGRQRPEPVGAVADLADPAYWALVR